MPDSVHGYIYMHTFKLIETQLTGLSCHWCYGLGCSSTGHGDAIDPPYRQKEVAFHLLSILHSHLHACKGLIKSHPLGEERL